MKFTGEDGSEWEAVMWDRHLKSDSENMTIKRIPLRPARPPAKKSLYERANSNGDPLLVLTDYIIALEKRVEELERKL